jgi:hypothetical protein
MLFLLGVDQSGFTWPALTTAAQRGISRSMSSPKALGESGVAIAPSAASC